MSEIPLFYWDTCVIIAWLKNEDREPTEMNGLHDVAEKIDTNKARLITSVLTTAEVLKCTLTNEANQIWENLFQRRNCMMIDTDDRIWKLSNEIRNYYQIQKEQTGLNTVTTPDAIHLATAIIYEADEFHTFDEYNTNKRRALIPLNGNVAGHNLIICKPSLPQLSLGLK